MSEHDKISLNTMIQCDSVSQNCATLAARRFSRYTIEPVSDSAENWRECAAVLKIERDGAEKAQW